MVPAEAFRTSLDGLASAPRMRRPRQMCLVGLYSVSLCSHESLKTSGQWEPGNLLQNQHHFSSCGLF